MLLMPSTPLRRHVAYYSVTTLGAKAMTYMPATSEVALVIFREGMSVLLGDGGKNTTIPSAYIEGPTLHPRNSVALADVEIISVHFNAGTAKSLLGFPVSELRNRAVSISSLNLRNLSEIVEAVKFAPSQRLAIETLDAGLLSAISEAHCKSLHPVATRTLHHLPVREMASQLGLSTRQLERRFSENYGLSPRDWKRVRRGADALQALVMGKRGAESLTTIAADHGFYDHAHMTREFHALCGMSPSAFAQRMNTAPEFWPIRVLRDLVAPCRMDTRQIVAALHN